ncbi:MAG: hypothetical protein JO332_20175 [Planctomycetaceae bacterium]|nr:hypothetical protein [Planctomycetaceae bacterium]
MNRRAAWRLIVAMGILGLVAFAGILLSQVRRESGPFAHDHDISITSWSIAPKVRFMPSGDSVLLDLAGYPTVYDIASGRELRRFEQGNPLALSPDGKLAAVEDTAHAPRGDGRVRVHILNFDSAENVRTLRGPGWSAGSCLAWSPDARWLARGNYQNSIDFWDLTQDVPVVNLRSDTNMDNAVEHLLFTSDGHFLISAESHGGVRVRTSGAWTLRTHFQFPKHDGHDQGVSSIALSPDGSLFAAGAGYSWSNSERTMRHGLIKIWRVTDWSEVSTFDLPSRPQAIAIDPDNSYLVYSIVKEVQVRNLRPGHIVQVVPWPRGVPPEVSFSADGRWLALAGNQGLLAFWKRPP